MPLDPTIWNPSMQGAPGADGRTIHSGVTAPSDSIGEDWDYYIDYVAWKIYGPKTSGAWPVGVSLIGADGNDGIQGIQGNKGNTGLQGLQGVAGINGSTIHSGFTAPGSGTGVDGDYYIDLALKQLYGPKTSGAWGVGVSLKGDDGADGPAGPPGELVPEFRVDSGWIQWKYTIDVSWNNLVTLASITGPTGAAGADGADGTDGVMASVVAGTNISVDSTDPANPIVSFSPPASAPYDIAYYRDTLEDGVDLFTIVLDRDVDFADDFAGSQLFAGVAATASSVFGVKHNGSSIGSITVGASGTTGTFATTGGAVNGVIGDRLTLVAPSPADATLAKVSITLKGTRDY